MTLISPRGVYYWVRDSLDVGKAVRISQIFKIEVSPLISLYISGAPVDLAPFRDSPDIAKDINRQVFLPFYILCREIIPI